MSLFFKPQNAIVCQYQNKFSDIPLKELEKIPGLFSALPQNLLPYLAGIQVYETQVVRFNFSHELSRKITLFKPGTLVCSTLSDETVQNLISLIVNFNNH